jgi:hypothetical protein
MRNLVVREYLESLNETNELDYIFPLLLESMGFSIVSTPKNSRGQSQYGKDVIAIGKDAQGVKSRFYFELKGNAAKDINDRTFFVKDGFRDSILAAKDTAYNDSSIPEFDSLPLRIVFVHNGLLMENTRPTYDSFIRREFPENNFERWDINKLTSLFSVYLFGACLFADEESYKLFKKTLVLLEVRSSEFNDLNSLLDRQLSKFPSPSIHKKRELSNTFSSVKLITAVIYSFAKNEKNLYPAKVCSDMAVLKTWAWILKNKLEGKKSIIERFNGLLLLQFKIYQDYYERTLPIAMQEKGLYDITNGGGERVCYPLRCFDYLASLIYFYEANNAFVHDKEKRHINYRIQREQIKQLLEHNCGFDSVMLDTQSIPILLLFHFVVLHKDNDEDVQFLCDYVIRVVENIVLRYHQQGMLPELYGNRIELAKSLHTRSEHYQDGSSLLLVTLCELCSFFQCQQVYEQIHDLVNESKVNLQVAYPCDDVEIEQLLFEANLSGNMCVETNIKLPETLSEFDRHFKKHFNPISFRTDTVGYGFLRLLAHIHFQSDMFPDFFNIGFLERLEKK